MAGILERLIEPQNTVVQDLKSMELQAAREILAEVFRVRLSEVDEMIKNRFEKVPSQEVCAEKGGLWPQEFWLEG